MNYSETKTYNLALSKGKSVPGIWEEGGKINDRGTAVIVTNFYGASKRAIFVTPAKAGKHAFIPVKRGDHVIEVMAMQDDLRILVYKLGHIIGDVLNNKPVATADAVCVGACENGEWYKRPSAGLSDAIQIAIKKAEWEDCSLPLYIRKPIEKAERATLCGTARIKPVDA